MSQRIRTRLLGLSVPGLVLASLFIAYGADMNQPDGPPTAQKSVLQRQMM